MAIREVMQRRLDDFGVRMPPLRFDLSHDTGPWESSTLKTSLATQIQYESGRDGPEKITHLMSLAWTRCDMIRAGMYAMAETLAMARKMR